MLETIISNSGQKKAALFTGRLQGIIAMTEHYAVLHTTWQQIKPTLTHILCALR